MKIPVNHPRYESLKLRHKIVEGMKTGLVAEAGLIAHGRGEAFDYLLGEKTVTEALKAEKAATALLLLANNPVISVNGNTAALCPKEVVKLANTVNAKIEVNLFYRTALREKLVAEVLRKNGASRVYGIEPERWKKIPELTSQRSKVDVEGIWSADVVLVPLEDGDRVEALNGLGKKTISIDLNPFSRTSCKAYISIVDNVVRALPNMIEIAEDMKNYDVKKLKETVSSYNNRENLEKVRVKMRKGLH